MADGSTPAPPENKAAGAGPPAAPVRTEFYSKLIAVLFLAAVLCLLLLEAPWAGETTDASREQTIDPLAELLFTDYGVSFLLLSLVMGAAIVGGLFLAREDPADDEGAGDKGQGAGHKEQGAGSREQGAGNKEQGAGNKEQGAVDDGKGTAGGKGDGSGGGAK